MPWKPSSPASPRTREPPAPGGARLTPRHWSNTSSATSARWAPSAAMTPPSPPTSTIGRAATSTTAADVTAGLSSLGVATGDTIFFHSSLKSMGHVIGGAGKPHGGDDADAGVRRTRAEGAESVIDGFLAA